MADNKKQALRELIDGFQIDKTAMLSDAFKEARKSADAERAAESIKTLTGLLDYKMSKDVHKHIDAKLIELIDRL